MAHIPYVPHDQAEGFLAGPSPLGRVQRAMIGAFGSDDVEGLRHHGFPDRAFLDIGQVTACYAYVNRLAEGLGVELETSWTEDERVLGREKFETRGQGRAVTWSS